MSSRMVMSLCPCRQSSSLRIYTALSFYRVQRVKRRLLRCGRVIWFKEGIREGGHAAHLTLQNVHTDPPRTDTSCTSSGNEREGWTLPDWLSRDIRTFSESSSGSYSSYATLWLSRLLTGSLAWKVTHSHSYWVCEPILT